MGIPSLWHRRHAMMLASQLPENLTDAELILQAMQELMVTFLKGDQVRIPDRKENILPFVAN